MTRKIFITQYTAFVELAMKLTNIAKRDGIECLERIIEDFDETEKVFKEGLRLIFDVEDSVPLINEILSNMISHEKDKYIRLYMTVQKRAVIGIKNGEGSHILHKVLLSLVDLTPKETRKIVNELFFKDEPKPEQDTNTQG
jgi:flagellar motor component MotA